MKTMIEKFHESEYGKNSDYCIAFYLGILCSIINQRDHRTYVDRFIKEGLINFRKFEDMKKLYIAIERFLFDDGESKVYREKVSNYFLQTTGENFDPDTAVMILGVGMSIRNPLESVLTFSEATKRWGLGHSTLREAAKHNRFLPGEIRKSGGTWLVTEEAMRRLYGEPKGGACMSKERIEIIEIIQLNRNGIRIEEEDLPLPLATLYFDDNGGSPDGNFDEDNIAGTWAVVDGRHEVGTYAYRSIDDVTLIKLAGLGR